MKKKLESGFTCPFCNSFGTVFIYTVADQSHVLRDVTEEEFQIGDYFDGLVLPGDLVICDYAAGGCTRDGIVEFGDSGIAAAKWNAIEVEK